MQLVEEPMEIEERRRELVEDKSGPVEVDERPLFRSHQPRPHSLPAQKKQKR